MLYPKSSLLTIASVGIISSSLVYLWIKLKSKINYVPITTVKKLFIYPIKALSGIEVDHLEITETVAKYGKYYDRYLSQLVLELIKRAKCDTYIYLLLDYGF